MNYPFLDPLWVNEDSPRSGGHTVSSQPSPHPRPPPFQAAKTGGERFVGLRQYSCRSNVTAGAAPADIMSWAILSHFPCVFATSTAVAWLTCEGATAMLANYASYSPFSRESSSFRSLPPMKNRAGQKTTRATPIAAQSLAFTCFSAERNVFRI